MKPSDHNRDQYNRYAAEYHAKRQDPKRSFWNDHLEQPMMVRLLKPIVKGKKVLEVGCGSGLFTSKLVKWVGGNSGGTKSGSTQSGSTRSEGIKFDGNVVGVDFSESMLEIARREVRGAEFIKSDIRKLPFPAKSFDIAASSLVLHYIKNPEPVFREVARVLRPRGVFVFSMHHPFSPVSVGGKFVLHGDDSNMTATNYFQNDEYTWRMLEGMELVSYHHTFEMLVSGLAKAGFVVEELLEAKPALSTMKIDPKAWEEASKVPTFCGFRVVKATD